MSQQQPRRTPSSNPSTSFHRRLSTCAVLALLAFAAVLALPQAAEAQPYKSYLALTGDPTNGWVRIPHSAALNPTAAFTFEAWVRSDSSSGSCRSIAGKDFTEAWWIGICGTTLRSYLKGGGSSHDGGTVPVGPWTHIAVTFDGANRRHYVNGELVATFAETAPLTTSTDEVRIGSDTAWNHSPTGRIDEVRIWNVARSQSQLRANINIPITSAQAGLVALYNFQGNANDLVGSHDGSLQGAGVSFFSFAVSDCNSSGATTLCLQSRFLVNSKFRTGLPGTAEGTGQTVAVANPGSGLFWFFSADNWEVMVKAIDGCGLNNRHWVFSAATTNVFYRLEVFDTHEGEQKIYFNYPGPPAPAVTDTSAFATCP